MIYLAYGSNLHPLRLSERVPSARLLDTAELTGFKLAFHKRSHDGSAKCNIVKADNSDGEVYCAIYDIDPKEKTALDAAEGVGRGYLDVPVSVEKNGMELDGFTYMAQQSHIVAHLKPYHWYKELVVMGAEYLCFPAEYIRSIASIESVEDSDAERLIQNTELIARIKSHR